MNNISWKTKIIGAVIVVGLALLGIFTMGFAKPSSPAVATVSGTDNATQSFISDSNGKVETVSPDNLIEGTILPTQEIKITFKEAIDGFDPNYHITITPKADVVVNLINDGKTIDIKPNPTLAVGTSYDVSIRSNMKFKSGDNLGKDLRLHFNTLNYRGV